MNWFTSISINNIIHSFEYIDLGNQLHYKRYNQKLHHIEYYDGKWKHWDHVPEINAVNMISGKGSKQNLCFQFPS